MARRGQADDDHRGLLSIGTDKLHCEDTLSIKFSTRKVGSMAHLIDSPSKRRGLRGPRFLRSMFLTVLLLGFVKFTTASSLTGLEPLPRSTHCIPRSNKSRRHPPWNPSPFIDADGFLCDSYARAPGEWEEEARLRTSISTDLPCNIRQVPGDGNCLFHSISLCLYHAENGTHWNIQSQEALDDLYLRSQFLRAQAVECLKTHSRRLFLQCRESLKAQELVQAAAQQYGLTADEYCEAMRQDCVWGGGPEIVALCNLLQRPIHVYELATATRRPEEGDLDGSEDRQSQSIRDSSCSSSRRQVDSRPSSPSFILRRMACFGSPRFDKRDALHILSADSRFPDLQPGTQLAAGNHFLAVFPVSETISRRKRLLRGGGSRIFKLRMTLHQDEEDLQEDDNETDSILSRCWSFWKRLAFQSL
jgi:hypothetical protein